MDDPQIFIEVRQVVGETVVERRVQILLHELTYIVNPGGVLLSMVHRALREVDQAAREVEHKDGL